MNESLFEVLPKQKQMKIRGHRARPGSGPDGESCGSCKQLYRHTTGGRTYMKCSLTNWRIGAGSTDIRLIDPACEFWGEERI